MATETMGRVLVNAKIENLADAFEVYKGRLHPDQIRAVDVTDALVDTGATLLSLAKSLIDRLDRLLVRSRVALTSAGEATTRIYGTCRLTIEGRDCSVDVCELPENCPVLLGQIPLELLDFVVDPKGRRLVGNPAHGGEHVIELN